jgi:hypothetical protein
MQYRATDNDFSSTAVLPKLPPARSRRLFPGQLRHSPADLEGLRRLLDRDYAVLTSLLRYTSDSPPKQSKIEVRMLGINYRLLGLSYGLSRRCSVAAARRTLDEMSLVVAHFANMMGERTMCSG